MPNFKPVKSFSIELSGSLACFTDPISKVERTSYPVPTAGALEYLIERIYGHPNIRYRIDKIHVLNPLKYVSMYLNERDNMGDVDFKTGAVKLQEASAAMQRMTTFLRDVRYVVEFTMFYDANYYQRKGLPVKAGENATKHIDQLSRRIAKGQFEYLPVFGLSECVADVDVAPKNYSDCTSVNANYYSLYKVAHLDDMTSKTAFTMVHVRNGLVDFSGCRIHVGDKEYTQDEFLNIDWRG